MNTISASRGFTLLEVMIAILVFSFGLLGLGLLESLSVKTTQSSSFRSQATAMANSILDSMRANRTDVLAGNYYTDFSSVTCASTDPTGSTTAARDLAVWKNLIACTLPGGLGQVHFPGGNQVEVDIAWTDSRWTTTPSATFSFTSTL